MGVDFAPQKRIGRGTFDAFLPGLGIAVECHGDFFHADPDVYPDGATCDTQRGYIEPAGLRLLVLWEKDMANVGARVVRVGREAKDRRLVALVGVATVLSIGHHLDHLARGNHLGWPLTSQVTPFTFSVIVYPLIALGVLLRVWGKGGPGFWAVLAGAGLVLVGVTHLGPFAAEPPRDIVEPYRSRAVGWAAFGLLIALLVTLATLAVYAGRRWWRGA